MAVQNSSLHDIAQFLETQWFKKAGLIASIIAAVSGELVWLANVNAAWWVTLTITLGTALIITLSWLGSRRPTRTKKDKIGFLVSIACSDDLEAKKLREDFVIPLRNLIKSGRTGGAFHFIELPKHLADSVLDADDAQVVRVRSRAHFMLYGRVRLRTIDGKDHHVIDLEGLVAHKPVPDHLQESLSREFTELLPRRVQLTTDNDLLAFQFTSEWADIVAKYIIGIAAALSGDLVYAENLYTDAAGRLNGKDARFPAYAKLAERIPLRLSELYEARARVAYDRWSVDHDVNHITDLGKFLARVEESRKANPAILNLLAIHKLLAENDAGAALEYLKSSKETQNAVWHYNVAFLLAYSGDLKSAIRYYRKGTQYELDPNGIAQIEDFICWVIEQQPDRYQLEYCLGFFNWKVKGDVLQAKKDFQSFLDHCDDNSFQKEKELAIRWLEELGAQGLRDQTWETSELGDKALAFGIE